MPKRRALAVLLPLLLAAACGRTSPESSGEKAGEALAAARSAEQQASAALATADGLTPRVEANEAGLEAAGERLDAVEAGVLALETGQSALDGRVEALELGGGGGVDVGVSVPDPEAAGFAVADGVTNVRQGFATLNGRVTTQGGRIGVVETAIGNIETTVVQVVNEGITNGNIQVDVDVGFTPPAVDVDPRADPDDAFPEYSQSTTLQEAIMALRYGNQIRFQAQENDTRLGELYDGTVRSYVQEAIAVLDKDLYDLFAGNASPALNTENLPQDGSFDDVRTAIESLYRGAGSQPYVLGPHPAQSSGALSFGGLYGVEAGTAMCKDAFAAVPTAHLCSPEEVQRALGQNRYGAALVNVVAWAAVYEGDSCEGLMSDDVATEGASLTVDLAFTSGTGNTGKHAYVTRGVTCNTPLSVLCCR